MSKKLSVVVALVGMCALSLFLLSCGSSSSRPSGLLYVLTQGSNGTGNNVSSFSIDLNSGNLSLINSNASTCSTANACGLPLDILLDPTGATAFVLSQGAISSYPVNSDGSFGAPTTAWTAAAGDTAIAMTRDVGGNFLYVITEGNQSSNPPLAPQLLVFSTKPGSTSLTPVSNAVSTLTRVPTALSAITFPTPSGATPPCAFTTSEEFLYVTSNHDLSQLHDDNTVSVYCVDSSGNLTDLTPNPPYATATDPISVLAVNTNRAGPSSGGGVFVYVGSQSQNAGALNGFQMCTVPNANCTSPDVTSARLNPVVTQPPSPGSNPVAIVVDPTNSFLYIVCYGSNQVWGYLISTTGTLTLLNPPNLPTGSQPVAMAMHPSVNSTGQFLYVSNNNSSNISGFSVSTTTGSMSSLNSFPVTSPAVPSGMAAR